MTTHSPTSLIDLLSNHLVLAQLAPYLSISALFNLSVTSRRFNEVICSDPNAFQRLDLSTVRGVPYHLCELEPYEPHTVVDDHGHSVEERERYCLPLKKLANISWKRDLLPTVQTLILDRQYVHVDMVRDILLDHACQIRLLSLIDVRGLDRLDFQHLIDDIFRGGRRLDSPRLEAIYYFGPPSVSGKFCDQPVASDADEDPNPWYLRSKVAFQPPEFEFLYSALLRATQGVLVWDAVLCRAPRHTYPNPRYIIPTIASVALGPRGCHICHSSPEGPGSTVNQLPLLSPPPLHSSLIKVAQEVPSNGPRTAPLPFYARCVSCLKHRWCVRCNKWWCENCYQFGGPNCYKENNARGLDSAGTKVSCYLFVADRVRACWIFALLIQSTRVAFFWYKRWLIYLCIVRVRRMWPLSKLLLC